MTEQRTRAAGEQVDPVSIDPAGLEPRGFDAPCTRRWRRWHANGSRCCRTPAARRAILEEVAALSDFLAEKMPALLGDWRAHRAAAPASPGRG